MATTDLPRYGDLCRLCAMKIDIGTGTFIFESQGASAELKKNIEMCLPIQMLEIDELPKMICQSCIFKIDLIVDFRNTSLSTQTYLLNLYKELTELQEKFVPQPLESTMDQPEMIMVQPSLHNFMNEQTVEELDLESMRQSDSSIILNASNFNLHSATTAGLVEQVLSSNHHNNQNNGHFSSVSSSSNCSSMQVHEQTNFDSIADAEVEAETEKECLMNNESFVEKYDENSTSDYKCEIVETKLDLDNLEEKEEDGLQLFYCNMSNCGKTFATKETFDIHYAKHFYRCSCCFALFTSKFTLHTHRKEEHGYSGIEIEADDDSLQIKTDNEDGGRLINNQSEESESEFRGGEIEDNEEENDGSANPLVKEESPGGKRKKSSPKVCKECGKTYKTNYKLMEHMRRHSGEKPYKCSMCEKAFRSKIGLAQHEATHTGKFEYACSTCGKGFQCKSYLIVHQRVHSDAKPYPCTTCGQNFKTKQSLLDHTNRHLGVKPYICETCGRGFITKGLCRAHQKVHTGEDNRKYSCKVCNKMFVSKSYLQTHARIHTGEKPFVCDVCGKGFLTRVDLKIHNTVHTGEKKFVCEMCGKAFARRDALRCHRRSHTGERPYSCDQCGQTFTQFSPMAIHKRLHTGERPYVCEICGKKFVSKSTMMAHSKKHTQVNNEENEASI